MFDGPSTRLPTPRPTPPRPAPIDTMALLPVLRTMAAEAMVEHLAMDAGVNATCAQRWLQDNWGAGADLRDHNHPWRTAALDPDSPPAKYGEAIAALAGACWRYRMTTGDDGVVLARGIIARDRGEALADHVMTTLGQSATVWDEIDDLLFECGPPSLPAAPEPTPAQHQAAAAARLDYALSLPEMDGLRECLDALRAAWRAQGSGEAPAVTAALNDLRERIGSIVNTPGEPDRAATLELVQTALNVWQVASGVPVKINLPPNRPGRST